MAITQKRKDELYDQLVQRSRQRLREMLTPPSIASRMYPKLKTNADDQRKQSPVQGWGHLKRSQQRSD